MLSHLKVFPRSQEPFGPSPFPKTPRCRSRARTSTGIDLLGKLQDAGTLKMLAKRAAPSTPSKVNVFRVYRLRPGSLTIFIVLSLSVNRDVDKVV